jgi:cellulose synthase/poly-beta-1,6-N-acetylglucosamine synthase-like glycosyltransferase
MEEIILFAYIFSLSVLFVFGSHGFIMIYYYLKFKARKRRDAAAPQHYPVVTVQLPVYNERYVVGRLIDASCAMVYPKDKLEIQVLDDSTDDTVGVVASYVERYRKLGFTITHVRRAHREGYKAGATSSPRPIFSCRPSRISQPIRPWGWCRPAGSI